VKSFKRIARPASLVFAAELLTFYFIYDSQDLNIEGYYWASFGALASIFNLLLLTLLWILMVEKKKVATALGVIVIKYAILIAIVQTIGSPSSADKVSRTAHFGYGFITYLAIVLIPISLEGWKSLRNVDEASF